MDLSLSDEQRDIAALAKQMLTDHTTADRFATLAAAGHWYDCELRAAFAEAGLFGVFIPSQHGGSGLGLIETALVMIAAGATAPRLPIYSAIVLGSMPLVRFGTDEQQAKWLPRLADGSAILTAGLEEPGAGADPLRPAASAVPDGAGWRVNGAKTCVPDARAAERILVAASLADGRVVLCLVDPKALGVTLREQIDITFGPAALMELDDVAVAPDDILVGPEEGAEALRWIIERATAALCAMQAGASESALTATARWVSDRKAFGRPLATFQAVSMRSADSFIALEANRLTMWQAIWRLEEELPATAEVAIAKWWAAESGTLVMTTAHRLQGGVSADMSSSQPRFTLLSRQIEFTLGAARQQLRILGATMAAEPSPEAATR